MPVSAPMSSPQSRCPMSTAETGVPWSRMGNSRAFNAHDKRSCIGEREYLPVYGEESTQKIH